MLTGDDVIINDLEVEFLFLTLIIIEVNFTVDGMYGRVVF